MNCDMFTCFINYQKVFDKIKNKKMMKALKNRDMDNKDLRVIWNLHWNQSANIKISVDRYADDAAIFTDSTNRLQELKNQRH